MLLYRNRRHRATGFYFQKVTGEFVISEFEKEGQVLMHGGNGGMRQDMRGYGVLGLIGARYRAIEKGDKKFVEDATERLTEIVASSRTPSVVHYDPDCRHTA